MAEIEHYHDLGHRLLATERMQRLNDTAVAVGNVKSAHQARAHHRRLERQAQGPRRRRPTAATAADLRSMGFGVVKASEVDG